MSYIKYILTLFVIFIILSSFNSSPNKYNRYNKNALRSHNYDKYKMNKDQNIDNDDGNISLYTYIVLGQSCLIIIACFYLMVSKIILIFKLNTKHLPMKCSEKKINTKRVFIKIGIYITIIFGIIMFDFWLML